MSAPSPQFRDFVLDQLPDGIGLGRFFSGLDLRRDGVQFAMLMGNRLYLRCDAALREDLLAEGGEVFSYTTKKGRVQVARYVSVPEDLLEAPERLSELTERALAVGRAAERKKRAKKSRKKPA